MFLVDQLENFPPKEDYSEKLMLVTDQSKLTNAKALDLVDAEGNG